MRRSIPSGDDVRLKNAREAAPASGGPVRAGSMLLANADADQPSLRATPLAVHEVIDRSPPLPIQIQTRFRIAAVIHIAGGRT